MMKLQERQKELLFYFLCPHKHMAFIISLQAVISYFSSSITPPHACDRCNSFGIMYLCVHVSLWVYSGYIIHHYNGIWGTCAPGRRNMHHQGVICTIVHKGDCLSVLSQLSRSRYGPKIWWRDCNVWNVCVRRSMGQEYWQGYIAGGRVNAQAFSFHIILKGMPFAHNNTPRR